MQHFITGNWFLHQIMPGACGLFLRGPALRHNTPAGLPYDRVSVPDYAELKIPQSSALRRLIVLQKRALNI
jgi:hypothetical protein